MRSYWSLLAKANENRDVGGGKHKVIVGLGATGYSVAKYLHAANIPFAVLDNNPAPERLKDLRHLIPGIEVRPIEARQFVDVSEVIVSPGVPLSLPTLEQCKDDGIKLTGDIAMFADLAKSPIVAITGSNGKSTVTSMVGELAQAQLSRVAVAGNIGTPCLDVLADDTDLYVLEVSSYQLELAIALPLKVAALLNLSPDHLDRYPSVEDYFAVKQHIFNHCDVAVVSLDLQSKISNLPASIISFGPNLPEDDSQYGLLGKAGETILMRGDKELIAASQLAIKGGHNIQNALAALAIGEGAGLVLSDMIDQLRKYKGLEHRCEWLGSFGGVDYVNDSKATNVGASISALESFGSSKNVVLILGGESKNADFSLMSSAIAKHARKVFIFGKDKLGISAALVKTGSNAEPPGIAGQVELFDELDQVVDAAVQASVPGDIVLFSPACASFDMFEDYQARGSSFKQLVREKAK
jgi:UDP-N-acetylmuramoylalanine--D-glutamate ligase